MTTKTVKRRRAQEKPAVRRPVIPDDLSYLTDTEFGQTMMRLAEEIAKEQGTRTTKEINRLMDLMRGGVSTHADLP